MLNRHNFFFNYWYSVSQRIPDPETTSTETTTIFQAKIDIISAAVVSGPGIRRPK